MSLKIRVWKAAPSGILFMVSVWPSTSAYNETDTQVAGPLKHVVNQGKSSMVKRSEIECSRMDQLGLIKPDDDDLTIASKLQAAFDLADALAEEGELELWSDDDIASYLNSIRH